MLLVFEVMMNIEIEIILSALDDDHGVSEKTWKLVLLWADLQSPEMTLILERTVEAQDDRFYLRKEDVQSVKDQLEDYTRKVLLEEL
jgi:hypothetical protein